MDKILVITVLIVFLSISTSALAWGKRGHDLMTQVAVETLVHKTEGRSDLNHAFQVKTRALSYLSNTPDILWRSNKQARHTKAVNRATHYIDLDYLYQTPKTLADIETDFAVSAALARSKQLRLERDVGTAVWRVLQFYESMRRTFLSAQKAEKKTDFTRQIDEAIQFAGFMSHFVGDLANPLHTTKDYDGWATGNGGIHRYFETDLIKAYTSDLGASVLNETRKGLLETRLSAYYHAEKVSEIMADPELLIWAFVLESYQNIDELIELDNRYSLIKPSQGKNSPAGGFRLQAKRKPPSDVAAHYENFVVERLALGAETLAQLWWLAWQSSGEPNLSAYESNWFPKRPSYVEPDYLN